MAEHKPLISVVIPAYNRAHMVGRAIMSVLTQTYRNLELIVVDDGSSDNTEEIVKGFNDDRVFYLKHEKNKGGSAARNTGIKAARGNYIALLDSDDEWLEDKLEKQIDKLLSSPEKVGVVYCGHMVVDDESGKVIDNRLPVERGYVHSVSFYHGFLGGGSKPLIKRGCFDKAGFFDEKLPALQDGDMYVRLSKHYEFDFVPEILVKHHVHAQKLAADLKARIKAREMFIKKHYGELEGYPDALANHFNRLGVLYSLNGEIPNARKCFWLSIKKRRRQRLAYGHIFWLYLAPRGYRKFQEKKVKKTSKSGKPLYW